MFKNGKDLTKVNAEDSSVVFNPYFKPWHHSLHQSEISEYIVKIDISHLPAGVYFVRIGDRVEKFVKE